MNIRTLGEFKKESRPFRLPSIEASASSALLCSPLFWDLNGPRKRFRPKAPKGKDNKKTESYTGGHKSGLAVENPNDINSIISKAETYSSFFGVHSENWMSSGNQRRERGPEQRGEDKLQNHSLPKRVPSRWWPIPRLQRAWVQEIHGRAEQRVIFGFFSSCLGMSQRNSKESTKKASMSGWRTGEKRNTLLRLLRPTWPFQGVRFQWGETPKSQKHLDSIKMRQLRSWMRPSPPLKSGSGSTMGRRPPSKSIWTREPQRFTNTSWSKPVNRLTSEKWSIVWHRRNWASSWWREDLPKKSAGKALSHPRTFRLLPWLKCLLSFPISNNTENIWKEGFEWN